MLKQYRSFLDGLHLLVTGLLTLGVYAALHAVMRGRPEPLRPFVDYLPAISVMTTVALFVLSRRRVGAFDPLATPRRLAAGVCVSYAAGLLAYVLLAYSLKLPHLSRAYLFGGLGWSGLAAAAWHLGIFHWQRAVHARSADAKRVLLVGDPQSLAQAAALLSDSRALGLRVAGALDTGKATAAEVERLLDALIVDYALVTDFRRDPAMVERVMEACLERGIEIWLKPAFLPGRIEFSRLDHLRDMPVFVFSMTPRQGPALLIKRGIDIAVSLALLPLLALPLLAIAALILYRDGGPVLFRQRRIGLSGREFTLLKFKSMSVPGPGSGLPGPGSGLPGRGRARLRNEQKGPVFKMTDDPRVTPLGKVLRTYSLDELPQLWNVLAGDMSLVGPRPPLPNEVSRYRPWQRRRLSMRPGITGLWQVGGRNSIPDFDDWVRLDLEYIDRWSLHLDLLIILRTIPAVVGGTGR